MKIAWFSPFSTKSAIARYSQAVVEELAKNAEVTVCHFDVDSSRDSTVPVKRFSSAAAVEDRFLSRHDLIVYNFGNYLPFHREIFVLSRRHPGVCVLHDFVMHHFFAALHLEYAPNPAAYSLLMQRLYGQEGRAAAEESLRPAGKRLWESDEVVRFPLFEEAIRGALGVIVHSGFFQRRVEASFAGPVRRIPLPYQVDRGPVLSRREIGVEATQTLIVTVGHVNPNKRIEAVINALGRLDSSAGPVVYAVLGPSSPEYRSQLDEAVQRNRLEGVVRFLGHVPDETLRAYLSHADVCVNLRFPAIEGASASAIEEMLFGKPVIVSDVGFFAELPDECVLKIHPQREAELAAVLETLIMDPGARARIGAAARQFAEHEFRASRYAVELVEFASEVQAARPLLALADWVGVECDRMGVGGEMEIVATAARELHLLFGEKKRLFTSKA